MKEALNLLTLLLKQAGASRVNSRAVKGAELPLSHQLGRGSLSLEVLE